MSWYLLPTKARQEKRVTTSLDEFGYTYYCPEITRKTNAGLVTEYLFPNYVFLELDKENGPFHKLRFIRGAFNLVKFGTDPMPIKATVIEAIKKQVEIHGKQQDGDYFQEGDRVRVTEGPFRELEGIFQRNARDRVIILIRVCGTLSNLDLKPTQVERV